MTLEQVQSETPQPGQPGGWRAWRRLLPAGRNSWRWRRSDGQAAETLRRVQQNLTGFSDSVEGVFLKVGGRLMDQQRQAREIAGQTSAMARVLSDDEGSLAVLTGVLEGTGERGQGDGNLVAACEMREKSQAILRAIEIFGRLVNTFDVLGIMTRIESARFEAAGGMFVGLADAVIALSRQIREHIGATAGSAQALLETTSEAAEEVRRAAEIRQQNLGPLLVQTRAGIAKIAEGRSRVSQANADLSARFESISSATGDLVAALQSHDIVRQQIEHVLDALSRLDSGQRSGPDWYATARLQSAQLEHSRATFAGSAGSIRDSLGRIECSIQDVAGDSASLLGSPDDREDSFFSSMEANLAGILSVLDSNSGADERLAQASVPVHYSGRAPGAGRGRTRGSGHGGSGTGRGSRSDFRHYREFPGSDPRGGPDAGCRSAAASKSIQDQAREGYARTMGHIQNLECQIRETVSGFGCQGEGLERLAEAVKLLQDLARRGQQPDAAGAAQMAAIYTMQSERAEV